MEIIHWTAAQDAELMRLKSAGYTHKQIAVHMKLTRNAVAGRIYRLKNKAHKQQAHKQQAHKQQAPKQQAPKKKAPKKKATKTLAPKAAPAPKSAAPAAPESEKPVVKPKAKTEAKPTSPKVEPEQKPALHGASAFANFSAGYRVTKPEDVKPGQAKLADPQAGDVARKTILELGRRDCRWPVGTPGAEGFGYCALAMDGAGPYCAAHKARAAVPRVSARRNQHTEGEAA